MGFVNVKKIGCRLKEGSSVGHHMLLNMSTIRAQIYCVRFC